MDFLNILTNPILLVPGCAWIIAQMAKAVINAIVNKKFSFDRLVGDGGMPSGHSATVTALAMMCGLTEGFGSTIFGLSMIFAIVVMHDAMGVRREAGKHARSIISIVEQLNDYFSEHDDKIKTEKLKVLVGHTPLQVFVGSLLGAVIALVYHFLLRN
jgi:acid phosphatase family membrane protein YuiD